MKIYVAGPYGRRAGLNEGECEVNTQEAIRWGRFLIERGHIPLIPHLYHWVHKGWAQTPSESAWFIICSDWIEDCDALFMLPGWRQSWGAKEELKIARQQGKRVYFHDEPLAVPYTTLIV